MATCGGRAVEVIAMRRLGVIVALGALLCVLGGVVTASPALAGRGHKWQPPSGPPFTLPALFCGFKLRVAFPVNKEFTKVLKTADGSMAFLFTGAVTVSYTNLANREDHYRARERAGEVLRSPRRLFYRSAYGAKRAVHSHASPREAVRAAHRGRDRGTAAVLGRRGREPYLRIPARSRPGERLRRAELALQP